MISVVILTLNEEQDLPKCLSSLHWTDNIHVLDSGSTDDTISIAQAYGAEVSYNKFKSFGAQRNFALRELSLKYEWILFLDADEIVTPAFRKSIVQAIQSASGEVAGFYCCWKMMLEDRWLKNCDNFPKWQFRLLRKGKAIFTDFGHGQKEGKVEGRIEYIKEPYLHYSFSKGWTQWIERQNGYSSLEARDRIIKRPPFKNIFSRNPSKRNPALKSRLSDVPGWPFIRFLQAYIFNGGFLEGTPGFTYCVNIAFQEFLISIKMREIRRKKRSEHFQRWEFIREQVTSE